MSTRKVIVIGSGPAGLTAAVYAARANLEPLVLEGEPSSTSDQPGGQLMMTTEVENYPGFPEGIMGPELMTRFREQAARFGADIRTERASRVDLSARPFGVWVGDPDAAEPTYQADALIISTGAQSLMLGLDHETELVGHGVSTCDLRRLLLPRGRHRGGGRWRLSPGGGHLPHQVRPVGDDRPPPGPATGVEDHAGTCVRQREDPVPVEPRRRRHRGRHQAFGITVRNVLTDELTSLPVSGLFVAIGHKPNTDLFKGQLEMEESGYLVTGLGHGATSTNVEGVFASGDVQDHVYRQAITAAGTGCEAAIDAERWLEAQGD